DAPDQPFVEAATMTAPAKTEPITSACPCADCEKQRYLVNQNATANKLPAARHRATELQLPDSSGSVPYAVAKVGLAQDFEARRREAMAQATHNPFSSFGMWRRCQVGGLAAAVAHRQVPAPEPPPGPRRFIVQWP